MFSVHIQTNKQTNSHRASLLGNWVPSASWGPTLPLLLRSSSALLSRGNEPLPGGRAHNGTSHNATFTGPHTGPEQQSANQTLSGRSPRGQSSIVVQEEDRGNNNQSPWLSDFSSCLLLLFSTQSGPNTSTSSRGTPTKELLERQGDHKDAREREWRKIKAWDHLDTPKETETCIVCTHDCSHDEILHCCFKWVCIAGYFRVSKGPKRTQLTHRLKPRPHTSRTNVSLPLPFIV